MGIAVGIDVGKSEHHCCALNLVAKTLQFAPKALDHAAALAWCSALKPAMICIDSPPRPNNGALSRRLPRTKRNTLRRVAEFQLGIGGCYGTPAGKPQPNDSNAWMASGMNLFEAIADQQSWRIDLGTGHGELLETHPTYAFKALLGHTKRMDEGIERFELDAGKLLRSKHSNEGHSQRIELLKQALAPLGVIVGNEIEKRWASLIDWVDATICALMAIWRADHRAKPIGDASEGSIYVYVPEQPWTVTRHAVVSTRGRGSREAASLKLDPPPNAVILRLGDNAFGSLDQQDTLDILEQAADKRGSWLPIGSNTSFRLRENLQAVDGRLFLAFGGELRAEVTVGDCREDMKNEVAYPGAENPWAPINSSHRWVEILDAKSVNIPEFEVISAGDWQEGFTGGQRALLWARVGS